MKINSTTLVFAALLAVVLMLSSTVPSGSAEAVAACGNGPQTLLSTLKQGDKTNAEDQISLTDIQFLNESTGRVAGNGFLLGTSNMGCNWQVIYEGQWNFTQIDFPDNVNGWALATTASSAHSNLLATADGGTHWNTIDTKGLSFVKIDRVDKNSGFGYTASGVYHTSNGGSSWQEITTPANTRGAYFTDVKNGWAVVLVPGKSNKVMRTVNGGRTWTNSLTVATPVTIGGEIYNQGSQVYALLYGDSGMSQVSYSLYASSNGGKQWKQIFAQSTAGGGPAPGGGNLGQGKGPANPGGHPGNMQLIGSNTAYLSAGSPASGLASVGRTYDAGKSWSNVNPTIEGYASRISFLSVKTGWIVITGHLNPSIYVTHDGGTTWSKRLQLK